MIRQRLSHRILNAAVAVGAIASMLVVAHSPVANAGSLQGSIVPSPNATGTPSWNIVTSPNTSTTENNNLRNVSCTSTSFCMAAGYYTTGSYGQTLIEEWNGTSWNIVTSPNTSTTENNYLQGESCASASFCMAAGYYVNASSVDQTLIEEWNGTSWSIITSPNTSTTQSNDFNGVSCASTTFCMAAGYYYNTGGYGQTLIEEWNGTSWNIVASPNTSTTENNYLNSVSCTSTSFCMAAGYTAGGGYPQTLVEEWNGTSWSIVTSANTSTTQNDYLVGVSCTSTSFCMAAGFYAGTYEQTLIEEFAPATQNNYLQSTSCTSSSFCMAAGYYIGGYDQTLIEEWNGTSWSIVTSPNMSTTQSNILNGVSCTSTSFCMAVGYYTGSYDQTLIEEWNGTSWSIVTSPNSSTTQTNILNGVSCTSATFCVAAGEYYTGTYNQTLIEEWNGTSWSIVTSPNTSTTQSNYLNGGVSCTSATFCVAAGFLYTGSYYQTLVEEWNGTSWSIVTSPNSSTTQTNILNGVSCTSATFCVAAGYYYTGTYYQTLIEEWNGTSWSIVASPNTSTTQSNYLNGGVSCTSSTSCMAAGYYSTGSYNQTLALEWNGTSWSIVTSPNTSTTSNNLFYGVSCTSTSVCMATGYYYTGTYYQTLVEEFGMVCSGGSLGLTAPTSAAFPAVTLNGTNQTSTLPLTVTPDDETGTGSGWNIDVTSTTFTNASSNTLPTSASSVTGVSSVTLPTGNCSAPTNTISPYPVTVPAGTTAPTAAAIYSANTGTGEGPADVTLNFAVAVPGSSFSGAYTSTWTFTIASGP